MDQHWLNNQWV